MLVRRSTCCVAEIEHAFPWQAATEDEVLAIRCRKCTKLCTFCIMNDETGKLVWWEPGDRPLR